MSDTLQHPNRNETVYVDWKVKVYKAVGQSLDEEIKLRSLNTSPPVTKPIAPERKLPPVRMSGKSASNLPYDPVGDMLAEKLFGDADDRHDTSENSAEIRDLHAKGLAAPVDITGEDGRVLRGNFYSARGHNLKENNSAADVSRPVVLLLTGSGGSAENQGFDVAKFYAETGASVLSANYAGFGGSDEPDGTPSELSMKQDAQSMLLHLVEMGYDPDQIIIHGYSMGAAAAASLQQAYEKKNVKFRGTVQDRPMLSAAHGVDSNLQSEKPAEHKGPVYRKAAATLTRMALGAFDGESAVKRLDSDGPLVITSDKGPFADRADALRAKLQKRRDNVEGSRSGASHGDHAAMLAVNGAALKKLIEHGESEKRDPSPEDTGDLVTQCLGWVTSLSSATSGVCEAIKTLQDKVSTMDEASAQTGEKADRISEITNLIDRVRGYFGDLLDILNYLPDLPTSQNLPGPVLSQIQWIEQRAKTAREMLPKAAFDLRRLLTQAPLRAANISVGCSSQEIDLVVTLAADVIGRLNDAGGPGPKNVALENEMIEVNNLRHTFGMDQRDLPGVNRDQYARVTGEQKKVLTHLQDTVQEIRRRRANEAPAANADANQVNA